MHGDVPDAGPLIEDSAPTRALLTVEVLRRPDPTAGLYEDVGVATRGETIELVAVPGGVVEVSALLAGR